MDHYTVKKRLAIFPSSAGMSLTNLDGKMVNLFLQCISKKTMLCFLAVVELISDPIPILVPIQAQPYCHTERRNEIL